MTPFDGLCAWMLLRSRSRAAVAGRRGADCQRNEDGCIACSFQHNPRNHKSVSCVAYLAPEANMSTALAAVKNETTRTNKAAENTLARRRSARRGMLGITNVGISMSSVTTIIAIARLTPRRCGPSRSTVSSLVTVYLLLRRAWKYYDTSSLARCALSKGSCSDLPGQPNGPVRIHSLRQLTRSDL